MNAVLQAGTRGCPGVLAGLARELPDVLLVLVPAEPRLFGPLQGARGLDEDVVMVATLTLDRALERARDALDEAAGQLGATLGGGTAPTRVAGAIVGPPWRERLPDVLGAGPGTLHAARGALELLRGVGADVAGAMEGSGWTLEAR